MEIKETNEYLVKESVDGAFYIDGLWGLGKTYFIKNFKNKYNLRIKALTIKKNVPDYLC